MNKKIIISLGVLVLILILGGVIFLNSKKTTLSPQAISTEEVNQTNSQTTQSEQKTLLDLFTLGIPQQCTVSTVQEGVSSNATIYITKDKLKGEIENTIEGVKTNSQILILNNSETYIWQDNSKEGFKMSLEKFSSGSEQAQTSNMNQPIDLEKPGNYSCSAWIPSEDKFTLPVGVKFTDMSSLVPNTGTNDNCFVCNSLTGDEKSQCLSALKCTN